ncbi:MAG: hypothetical protein QOC96_1559 [Acidobacteriota bacterium]|jgi:VWFA-related protein|nr:hypothetical protein [Acidobacteriota bacterium]
MCSKSLSIILLITIGLTPLYAQKNPTPPGSTNTQEQTETVRVGTSVVQMDVIVTDKNGRRIKGLTAADFQVMDESQPQTIDYFVSMEGAKIVRADNATTAGSKGKDETPVIPLTVPYQGRHITLVFDDLSLSSENFLRSRNALADYINNKLRDSDMTAILSTGGSIGSLQQFTNDRQRLLSALNRIALQNTGAGRTRNKFNLTLAEATRIDSGDERVLSAVVQRVSTETLANQLSSTPTLAQPGLGTRGGPDRSESLTNADKQALETQIRGAARSLISQSALDTRNVLNTLANLFNSMADLPGRKIVILLTEALSTLGNSSEDLSTRLYQLIDLARRSGVSVYALDAAGLRTNSALASEQVTASGLQIRNTTAEASFSDFEKLGVARSLVSGTGGQLFANTNDIGAGLERAVEDSSSYYVLGFKPAVLDNKFHRLMVNIKGKPDLVVRTRRGYLAVNRETVRGTNAELLDALLRSPVPHLDLPLEIVANVVPKVDEQVVLTGLHVGHNYLTLPEATATDQTAAYEVVSYIFAAGRDKPVGGVVHTMTYDLAKNPEARQKLKTEGFVLVKEYTQLPPGNYQIRAVIREKATGAIGSAYQFFEVPDVKNSKAVSLSGLVLTVAGRIGFSGYNSFKGGAEMEVRYLIYNLPRETAGLTQHVKLLDSDGRVLMDSPLALSTIPATGDTTQYPQGTRLNLPAARGHYALLVTLRDAKGKMDIERRTDFTVE